MVGSGLSGTKTNHTRDVIVVNVNSTHRSQKAEQNSQHASDSYWGQQCS
jgi:hypothetical protein